MTVEEYKETLSEYLKEQIATISEWQKKKDISIFMEGVLYGRRRALEDVYEKAILEGEDER